jgi:hypothetical protein
MSGCLLRFGACEEGRSDDSELQASLQVKPLVFREGNIGLAAFEFTLKNASQRDVDTRPASWWVVIDTDPFSVERRKTVRVPTDGPQPIGGWGTLYAGQSYQFSRMFDCSDFLRKPGSYAVWWKGERFHSTPIKLQILPKR